MGVEARDLPMMECCSEKRVGSVVYTSGNSSQKFCFAKGDLPKECLSDDSGCIVKGSTDYYGNDITHTTMASVQACADFCASTLGCRFWTYNHHTKLCWLKSSRTGWTYVLDAVSGNRACGTSDQFRGCCSWRNITGSAEKDGFY